MLGRRLLLGLVGGVALVVATTAVVADANATDNHGRLAANGHSLVAASGLEPAVLAARTASGTDQLVSNSQRPTRLTGLTLAAAFAAFLLGLGATRRRTAPSAGAPAPDAVFGRGNPSRGPPLLQRAAT